MGLLFLLEDFASSANRTRYARSTLIIYNFSDFMHVCGDGQGQIFGQI